jgi:hypothetical protein
VEITEILKELERNTGAFPRRALEAAVRRREEIAPELLQILEDTIARVEECASEDKDGAYFAHLYAMFLLAQSGLCSTLRGGSVCMPAAALHNSAYRSFRNWPRPRLSLSMARLGAECALLIGTHAAAEDN